MDYFRIMPGAKSVHAGECLEGGFIGADWKAPDLTESTSGPLLRELEGPCRLKF